MYLYKMGTAFLLASIISGFCFAAQPAILSGDILNPDELEAKDIYMFDGLLATAQVYGLMNMTKVSDAGLNLIGEHIDRNTGAILYRSTAKIKLLKQRSDCRQIKETFAKADCLKNLTNSFVEYGSVASKAKFLRISLHGLVSWDEKSQALKVMNTSHEQFGMAQGCMKNAVCVSAGPFDQMNNHNVLCLHLPAHYSDVVQAGPLPEMEARKLSQKYGSLINIPSTVVFEVTRPITALKQFQQCTQPGFVGNHLWAEGWIEPRAMLFGSPTDASFVATDIKFVKRQ